MFGIKALTMASAVIASAVTSVAYEPVDRVNPEIGTISHMLVPTYPATQLPNGMLRFTPPTESFVTDRIRPFRLLVPAHREKGVFEMFPVNGNRPLSGRWSATWDQQKARPYSYSVWLDSEQTTVSLVPAARAALVTFGFEASDRHAVVIRPAAREGRLVSDGAVVTGWDFFRQTKVFLRAEFNPAPTAWEKTADGGVAALFGTVPETVRMRYAVSYVSQEQAAANARDGVPDWDAARVASAARAIWNRTLGQIEVEGGTENEQIVFYTALWRCYERMVNSTEDGRYLGYDKSVHTTDGLDYYTDDWTWDTYRAQHPLMCLLRPGAQAAKLQSYVRMSEQNAEKWVPTFPNVNADRHGMNGFHTPSLFLDAWRKGIRGFDLRAALEACLRTERESSRLPWYRGPKGRLDTFFDAHGWMPALHPGEEEHDKPKVLSAWWERRQAVAVTLAAAYDAWCIAELAREVRAQARPEERAAWDAVVKEYEAKSRVHLNLWKADTGFFHPKDEKGVWIEPFDYRYAGGQGARDYYDENNAWTYIWDVQHDLPGLVSLLGGPKKFTAKLDTMFNTGYGRPRWEFYNVLPDSTGNMGMFTMGNEPSFHIPYLYNYAGEPWKTQKLVRKVLTAWFRNDLMGLCGDEDGGGMSAFAVWSSLGFYPVTPGSPVYTWGSPVFKRAVIHLENGKDLVLEAPESDVHAKYIQSVTINGKPSDSVFIHHEDVARGGRVTVKMADRPNRKWGVSTLRPAP